MAFNRVNPPKQVVLPEKVRGDVSLKRAFDDVYYILFQMWKRLGAGDDWVSDSLESGYEFDDVRVEDVKEQFKFIEINTSSNHETITNEIVKCNARNLTVTLNPEPEDQEKVIIHSKLGRTYINPNGKTINGEDSAFMRRKYTTWDIIYLLDSDEWVIV